MYKPTESYTELGTIQQSRTQNWVQTNRAVHRTGYKPAETYTELGTNQQSRTQNWVQTETLRTVYKPTVTQNYDQTFRDVKNHGQINGDKEPRSNQDREPRPNHRRRRNAGKPTEMKNHDQNNGDANNGVAEPRSKQRRRRTRSKQQRRRTIQSEEKLQQPRINGHTEARTNESVGIVATYILRETKTTYRFNHWWVQGRTAASLKQRAIISCCTTSHHCARPS